MKRLFFTAGLICTLLFSISSARAARPGSVAPPPPDCSPASNNWAGFPSFAYILRNSDSTYDVRVASQNGLCSKRVGEARTGSAYSLSFAASGTQYTLAWIGVSKVHVSRFELGVSETATTISANTTVFRSSGHWADLSADAAAIAYTSTLPTAEAEVRVAQLTNPDATGASDFVIHRFYDSGDARVWWSPWSKIYVTQVSAADGKRLRSLDPAVSVENQTPATLLTLAAASPLVVNELFQIGDLSGGYTAVGNAVPGPAVMFQGYFTTGVKRGGQTGSWCTAIYAIDANTGAFLLGSVSSPSSIIGFTPSLTERGTVLFGNSTAPRSGSSCTATGNYSERPLSSSAVATIQSNVVGSSPAGLKRL